MVGFSKDVEHKCHTHMEEEGIFWGRVKATHSWMLTHVELIEFE